MASGCVAFSEIGVVIAVDAFERPSLTCGFLMKSHPLPNSRGYRDSATRRARHLGVQLDVGEVSSKDLPEKLAVWR